MINAQDTGYEENCSVRFPERIVASLSPTDRKIESFGRLLCFDWSSPPPVANLFQTLATSVFEKTYMMTGVFKFMDVGPDLGLPSLVMSR
jgi:hypothetical protein